MILAPHSVQLVVLRFRFEACVAVTCRNRRIVGFFWRDAKRHLTTCGPNIPHVTGKSYDAIS